MHEPSFIHIWLSRIYKWDRLVVSVLNENKIKQTISYLILLAVLGIGYNLGFYNNFFFNLNVIKNYFILITL